MSLKFRAWDLFAKRYFYPNSPNQQHFVLTLNGEFVNLQNGSGWSDYVVQQYIGIRDADGNDIYEGDIIGHACPVETINKCVVRWSEEGSDCHPSFIISDSMIHGGKIKILGNIFENPELLES